jgi:hypothetical protein
MLEQQQRGGQQTQKQKEKSLSLDPVRAGQVFHALESIVAA